MKNLALIFALFVVAGAAAQESTNLGFRFPIRVVSGQRVDLRYLFEHWRNGPNAVTNSRWVLVTGKITEDNPSGWVVDGTTESASGVSLHQKVLIENPPRAEKQALEDSLEQKKALEQEDASLESQAKSLEHAPKPRHYYLIEGNVRYSFSAPQNVAAAANSQKATNDLNQASEGKSEVSQIDKELAKIPTSGSGKDVVYRVDFFVFYTGQMRNGMPVLDFGISTR